MQRSITLDGIRGLAILMVMAYHLWQDVPAVTGLDRFVASGVSFLWTGVDLFFVLSGFLITRILYFNRESPRYFQSFYARRILRIFPLYYLALFLVLGLPWLLGRPLVDASPAWFVVHVSNFYTVFHHYPRRIVAHFWSLAIEEQFYLVWPLIRFLGNRRRMMTLCIGLIALAIGIRTTMLFAEAAPRQIYALTFARMDALACGALAGLWLAGPGSAERRQRRWLAMAAAVAAALLTVGLALDGGAIRGWSPVSQALNYTAIAVLGGCFIAASQMAPAAAWWKRLLEYPLLPFLGKYSYSMYMFHIWLDAAARALKFHPATNPAISPWPASWGATPAMLVYYVILVAALSGISFLSWRFFEEPILRLKSRFDYAPPRPATGAAAEQFA